MSQLVVIAKACKPGRVKTRLQPAVSAETAARIARVALECTLDVVDELADRTPGLDRVLYFDGDADGYLRTGWRLLPQPAGPLDARIAELLGALPGPLLLIGMDTPQLTPELLAPALAPAPGEAWLGPAADGGYWALGLHQAEPGLVAGVPMSRPDTAARQAERLEAAGLRLRWLEPLRDLDTAADLAALAGASRFGRALAAAGIEVPT